MHLNEGTRNSCVSRYILTYYSHQPVINKHFANRDNNNDGISFGSKNDPTCPSVIKHQNKTKCPSILQHQTTQIVRLYGIITQGKIPFKMHNQFNDALRINQMTLKIKTLFRI
jgi:hypothetical protein